METNDLAIRNILNEVSLKYVLFQIKGLNQNYKSIQNYKNYISFSLYNSVFQVMSRRRFLIVHGRLNFLIKRNR